MSLLNSPRQWSGVAKSFHWLMAALIFAAIVLGLIAEDMPMSPAKLNVFIWHKSLGITVLVLFVLRLLWRLFMSAPHAASKLSVFNEKLADLGHWALYGLMLLLPLSGWVLNSAADFPFRWFGLFAVPSITEPSDSLKELGETIHVGAAWVLLVALAGHIAMAIKHHFHGSDVLLRMAPVSMFGRVTVGLLFAAVIVVGWYAADLGSNPAVLNKPSTAQPLMKQDSVLDEDSGGTVAVDRAPAWTQLPESSLRFVATYDAVAFDGEFKVFNSDIYFSPTALPESSFNADITLTSVNTQSDERDSMLPDSDWFYTDEFPVATYRATTFRTLGDNRYVADGVLRLKGIEKPVALTFTWTETDIARAHLQGSAQLDRRDFNIGSGMWADDATVGFSVEVQVDLLLELAK